MFKATLTESLDFRNCSFVVVCLTDFNKGSIFRHMRDNSQELMSMFDKHTNKHTEKLKDRYLNSYVRNLNAYICHLLEVGVIIKTHLQSSNNKELLYDRVACLNLACHQLIAEIKVSH